MLVPCINLQGWVSTPPRRSTLLAIVIRQSAEHIYFMHKWKDWSEQVYNYTGTLSHIIPEGHIDRKIEVLTTRPTSAQFLFESITMAGETRGNPPFQLSCIYIYMHNCMVSVYMYECIDIVWEKRKRKAKSEIHRRSIFLSTPVTGTMLTWRMKNHIDLRASTALYSWMAYVWRNNPFFHLLPFSLVLV